jgi:hypothetical protein
VFVTAPPDMLAVALYVGRIQTARLAERSRPTCLLVQTIGQLAQENMLLLNRRERCLAGLLVRCGSQRNRFPQIALL